MFKYKHLNTEQVNVSFKLRQNKSSTIVYHKEIGEKAEYFFF